MARSPDAAPEAPAPAGPLAVDVVVDNYNYARFLGAAIESALDQTYEHVSVIVVDDGSTDDSRSVIESFGGRIIPVFKENGGQASAFNAGLDHSQGDIVIFLDADDMLAPTAAARVAAAFAGQPGLARLHYRVAVVDEAGRPTGTLKPAPHIRLPAGDLRSATVRFPFDLARPATSGNAFSRQVLREIAPVQGIGLGAADWYVVHVATLYGPVGAIDEPLAFYRLHGENTYETTDATLDLEHVRKTIRWNAATRRFIQDAARQLGLPCDPRDASMCEVADRTISLKLDRGHHPISGDTLPHLVALGARSASRRFDIGPLMRVGFIAWLTALVVSPRPLARWLAEIFVFPERREPVNRLLRSLQRRP